MAILRKIARCFVPICDEQPEKQKKFIPNTNIEYNREVKDALGNTAAYEQAGGNWITIRPASKNKVTGALVCSNEGDESFAAMQALSYPIFNGSSGL